MEKTIRIDGKDYKMKSSAYTQFAYKNETGRSMLKDITDLQHVDLKNIKDNLDILDNLNYTILQIAYVMIKEADDKQVGSFEEFVKGISDIYGDIQWINDTIEVAISPLSKGLSKKSETN